MKKGFRLLGLFCLVVSSAYAADDTTNSDVSRTSSDGYKLVWNDEFNASILDKDSWNIEINGNGNGNAELQYYTDKPDNISMGTEPESGAHCLIITAKREDYKGKSFTSGRITTADKVYFTRGKLVSRIKFPKTKNGLWPAFWLLGNDYKENGWPSCGEVDILEMGHADGIKAGTQDRYFNGACHWGFYKNGVYPNYAKATTNDYSLQDGEFHTFTLEWDENFISMYLDQDKFPDKEPYYKIGVDEVVGEWATGRYFQHDFFVIFNLAVGGYFTGILDPNQITALPKNGEAKMYVDWVRLYQKEDDLNAIVPDSYTNGIKNYMAQDTFGSNRVYDVLGRRVSKIDARGLYLIQTPNGVKKYICSSN